MIGVNDDLESRRLQFFLQDIVVGGRHAHERFAHLQFFKEALVFPGKLHDLVRLFGLGVDHDAVHPCLQINPGAGECVFHAGAGDQAFDAGDDHEVVGGLHFFAALDFLREHFGFLQNLTGAGFQAVAFGKYFVLDDDRRDAGPFHFGHHILEGVGVAAGIAVNDHGFLRDGQDFLNGMQTGIEADYFDIRMALGSGIGQTAFPDGVELDG